MEQENFNVCAGIRAAANIISRRLWALGAPFGEGMTGGQCYIMGYLMKNPGKKIYQKDIETKFRIRRSTATRMLQALEKNGFILRASEEKDGRLKLLMPTEKAEAVHKRIDAGIREMELRLMEGITDEETRALRRVCEKIRFNAEKMEEERPC